MEILQNFIVIEGIDGAGTTTQMHRMTSYFKKKGKPVWQTCEPTDLPTGKLIRSILKGDIEACDDTIARLFAADRNEHIYGKEGIRNRCQHEIVISDRYLFSSIAYQGALIPVEKVIDYNKNFPMPQLIIFLDIPEKTGELRLQNRESRDIYEKQDFQLKVRKNYLDLWKELKQDKKINLHILDGAQASDEVSNAIYEILDTEFPFI